MTICPRCAKNRASIHTCTPTEYARGMEAENAALGARFAPIAESALKAGLLGSMDRLLDPQSGRGAVRLSQILNAWYEANAQLTALKARVEELEAIPPIPGDLNDAAMHRAALTRMGTTGETFIVAQLTLERDSARNGRDAWHTAQREALEVIYAEQEENENLQSELTASSAEAAQALEALKITRIPVEKVLGLTELDPWIRRMLEDAESILDSIPGVATQWLSENYIPRSEVEAMQREAALKESEAYATGRKDAQAEDIHILRAERQLLQSAWKYVSLAAHHAEGHAPNPYQAAAGELEDRIRTRIHSTPALGFALPSPPASKEPK